VAGIEANLTFSDIVELLKKYGIVTITSIVGYREDIQDVMSALDLGVIPSIGSEVICRVAFELMAVGVPLWLLMWGCYLRLCLKKISII